LDGSQKNIVAQYSMLSTILPSIVAREQRT